jgi:hypothetical protein
MHRVLLINQTKNPSREEISTSERSVGELFFAKFDLKWAGYNLVPDGMKKAAGWLVPDAQVAAMSEYLSDYTLAGYNIAMYEPCRKAQGGFGHRQKI